MLVAFALAMLAADEAPRDVTARPPAKDFLIIPLRVHVLTGDEPDVDCALKDTDVRRVIGKVNRVWSVAGVYFGLESIVREPAENVAQFRRLRDAMPANSLHPYRVLRPDKTRKFDGLHVYYVHHMPVNGVHMGDDFAFVQETASLRPVEGGIDEPIPRVTSHELGHALGLPHRQDRTNLMASGTTGTLLNEAEVRVARYHAAKVKGAMTYEDCRAAAVRAAVEKDQETAARLRRWVAEADPG